MQFARRIALVAGVLPMLFSAALAGSIDIYEHNGSVIEWAVEGRNATARYSRPKDILVRAGISPGTVLFEGRYDDDRIVGTAFAFKPGCEPAGYEVAGTIDEQRIVLRGPGPKRDPNSCRVTGYSLDSPHAVLVFTFAAKRQ